MWVAAGKIDDMKSEKNKTIDLTVEEGKAYLDRCLRYEEGNEYKEEQISDKILIGDSLKVAGTLPAGFVDLMIADPPYNLDKQFHGYNFHEMAYEAYEKYTEEWICAVKPLLKQNASIYE